MIQRVYWTTEAQRTFNANLEYLSKEWDAHVINRFLDRVDDVIQKISMNPRMFERHVSPDVIYKCVVHERIVLYYRIVGHDRIDLLTFWNTYQDPKMMKL